MANIEYAHPFKSMIEGQAAAQQAIQRAQAARQTNLDYRFNEWYQPLKQAEQQSQTGGELLKQAAAIAHYTGDYSNYNAILAHYLGVPLERLPPGYAGGKGGAQQTKAADLSTNLLPVPMAYGNVFQAGGVSNYPQIPGAPDDPELHAARRDALIRYYKTLGVDPSAAAGGAVPELDPTHGIAPPGTTTPVGPTAPATAPINGQPPIPAPEQAPVPQATMAAPRIPGANAAAADATKSLGAGDAAAAYGIPQAAKGPSIFDGEYDPAAFGSS